MKNVKEGTYEKTGFTPMDRAFLAKYDAVKIKEDVTRICEESIEYYRGILGGAFYQEDMSTEELYAGIGFVIGHEISHAFDTNGAQFDASGALNNWWTEKDYSAFLERAQVSRI